MKIAFYLDNENHKGVDYSKPENGNPGIGGTQYIIWTISYYLNKYYGDEIDIILIAPLIETLPNELISICAKDLLDGVNIAKQIKADIFIFRGPQNNPLLFKTIDELQLKSIMWNHCFEDYSSLKLAAKCKYLVRNICVGKEQYDKLRDHDIFKKSSYIYNALDFSLYDNDIMELNKKSNIVCYMGSITYTKGFHVLARIWKEVVKRVPDAQLYVIGSGKLYDKNSKMGKYNIAESSYENTFIKYLINDDGTIIDSVHFKGVVGGEDKLKLMSRAKVGIANPSGLGETFCIVAVEFQALGVPVVSINKYGLLDTVKNNLTGLLFNNDNEFINDIVRLLNDDNLNEQYGKNGIKYVRNNFQMKSICNEWMKVFYQIMKGEYVVQLLDSSNYYNELKWLRELNRRIRKIFSFMPSIFWYDDAIKRGKKLIKLVIKKLYLPIKELQ